MHTYVKVVCIYSLNYIWIMFEYLWLSYCHDLPYSWTLSYSIYYVYNLLIYKQVNIFTCLNLLVYKKINYNVASKSKLNKYFKNLFLTSLIYSVNYKKKVVGLIHKNPISLVYLIFFSLLIDKNCFIN